MNYILVGIYLLFIFISTLFVYKYMGKTGLLCWIIVNLLACNIQTVKTIELFGRLISLGNISYGAIFLSTDILNEKYGLKEAKKSVYVSFGAMIMFLIMMQLTIMLIPSAEDQSHEHLVEIFSLLPRITVGSLVAYFSSQLLDTILYDKLKKIKAKLWIRNNVSTIVSQILDTLIFVVISFAGIYSTKAIIELILTMLSFKVMIALFDTPFLYIAKKIKGSETDDN